MKRSVTNTTESQREKELVLVEGLMYAYDGKDPSLAIEAQEARGQRELVESDTLPTEGLEAVAKVLGIQVGDPVEADGLFTYVTLPEGWTKSGTSHAMHSDLRDAEGEKRAGMFYKAAFYDRRADIHLEPRCANPECLHMLERHPYTEYEKPQPCERCGCADFARPPRV